MFADALKHCKNNTLEKVGLGFFEHSNVETYTLQVLPILQFNRERRRFQENETGHTHAERLMCALEFAQTTDNHHLRFWLVRNHAGDLRVPPLCFRGREQEAEQVQTHQGKRQRIAK
jgi:hypothetical protein